jgi:magnesium transporter
MTATPVVASLDPYENGLGPNPRARTRLYREGTCLLQDFPVTDISEHLAEPGSVVWLDLCRPTPADFDMVNTEFGLHELAVEDALHESQRPKLDRYATHLFLSAYAVTLDSATARLDASEIAVFITDQALITVRKDDRFDITPWWPGGTPHPTLPNTVWPSCCTACSTTSSIATSPPYSSSTRASSNSKT